MYNASRERAYGYGPSLGQILRRGLDTSLSLILRSVIGHVALLKARITAHTPFSNCLGLLFRSRGA